MTERQARRIKPRLASLTEAIKEAVAEGMEPAEAVDEAVRSTGSPTPASILWGICNVATGPCTAGWTSILSAHVAPQ